jgi:hypothetical protein
MTKGRVAAALLAAIAFTIFAQTASAQYPPPKGNLVCVFSEVNVKFHQEITLTVTLRDTAGGLMSNQAIHFSFVSQPGVTRLSTSSEFTNSAGQAFVKIFPGDKLGQVIVSAKSDGLECRAALQIVQAQELAVKTIVPPATGDGGLAVGRVGGFTTFIGLLAAAGIAFAVIAAVVLIERRLTNRIR